MFILVWLGHTNILFGMALAIPAIPLPPPLVLWPNDCYQSIAWLKY